MAGLTWIGKALVEMATKELPTFVSRVRAYFAKPDLRFFQVEGTYAGLSEPARIVLWHLCDGEKKPEVLAQILRDARIDANTDSVLTELESADLTIHNYAGLRFIKQEHLGLIRKLCRK